MEPADKAELNFVNAAPFCRRKRSFLKTGQVLIKKEYEICRADLKEEITTDAILFLRFHRKTLWYSSKAFVKGGFRGLNLPFLLLAEK